MPLLISTPAWSGRLPPDDPGHRRFSVGDLGFFGMVVFLISLGVFFLAALLLHLTMRLSAPAWPPPGLPALPPVLWLSTVVLVATSVVLHLALSAVRRDAIVRMRRLLVTAGALGLVFLACQVGCWWSFLSASFPDHLWRYAAFFYVFTAIHALHVIGGFPPLALVLRNSLAGRYSRFRHAGVRHCAMYWHFLDGVWLIMFAAIMIPG